MGVKIAYSSLQLVELSPGRRIIARHSRKNNDVRSISLYFVGWQYPLPAKANYEFEFNLAKMRIKSARRYSSFAENHLCRSAFRRNRYAIFVLKCAVLRLPQK